MQANVLKSLRKKFVELRNSLAVTVQNSSFEIDVAGDEVDKLQGQNLVNVQNKISQGHIAKIRQLDRAIDKIDSGIFGECEECGENIGAKRLEAMPGATLCISCAERAEFK